MYNDAQFRQRLIYLLNQAQTNPNLAERRTAFAQALADLHAIDQVSQGRLPAGPVEYQQRGDRLMHEFDRGAQGQPGQPVPPSSMVHLDQIHPPIIGNYNEPSIAPSRILVVPGIPSVDPDSDSTTTKLDFTAQGGCDNGLLIGMHGTVLDDTAGVEAAGNYEYGSIELQATFNDDENIITDGERATFVKYSDLFTPGDRTPFPILRAVSSTDSMFFQWRNTQPAATGHTLQPSLMFYFLRGVYPGLRKR